jgi:hypothetical protein
MKFYYNGKLIRTSKTGEYKYALLDQNGKCLTCSATLKGAQSYKDSAISKKRNSIKSNENLINALRTGASHFDAIANGKTSRVKIEKDYIGHSLEFAQTIVAELNESIELISNGWQIVELEARA